MYSNFKQWKHIFSLSYINFVQWGIGSVRGVFLHFRRPSPHYMSQIPVMKSDSAQFIYIAESESSLYNTSQEWVIFQISPWKWKQTTNNSRKIFWHAVSWLLTVFIQWRSFLPGLLIESCCHHSSSCSNRACNPPLGYIN